MAGILSGLLDRTNEVNELKAKLESMARENARLARWHLEEYERRLFSDRQIKHILKERGHAHNGAFTKLAKDIFFWSERNWPKRTPKDALCSATEELGELMRAQSKYEQGIRGTPEFWVEEAQKEFGDVLIALLDYAIQRGWNPASVLLARWREVSKRNWNLFPKNGTTE